MQQPPIFFVSGLPRSGSTLLMNLLGQNPAHHVTPTNALLDLLVTSRDQWTQFPEFRAQGLDVIQPRILSSLRAMIEGFYRQEFKQGKVVFDKCRGWLAYIELMEQVLQRPIKVIVTVRDIRAIVASFEKIYQRNPARVSRPENYFVGQTIEGRAALLLAKEGIIGIAIARLRDALRRPHKSQVIFLPYDDLCRNTQLVLNNLHQALGLPAFTYDINNVEQLTYEDDSVHGMPSLHDVRKIVAPPEKEPWNGVLPPEFCNALMRDFSDIQRMAGIS